MVWRVVTANVNGIRAASRRSGLDWLANSGADVVCLQEIRAQQAQVQAALADSELASWFVKIVEAPEKGRSGVAVLSRMEPSDSRETVSPPGLAGQGRWVEVDLETNVGPVTVVSVYVHSGEAGTPKQDAKYDFLEAMNERLAAMAQSAQTSGRHVLVCGDFNIAHREIDIKNWKGNLKSAGFLPEERAYLDRWFDGQWTDLGRALGGDGPGPYTWWSWRGQAFDNDAGWRIDYQIATSELASRCRSAVVGRAPTYQDRWSDHAPLIVDFA